MNANLLRLFEKIVSLVLSVMLTFIMLGIAIGVGRLFMGLVNLLTLGHPTTQYLHLVGDVLTLFVLIELSRSLVQFFTVHRLRMTYIVDATIVFVLRDVMIGLFEKTLPVSAIYALSFLIFVLGALRISSVLVFQREKHMITDTTPR
ncbi:MAG: phosphate-starvation-inducible PsiE family protein [Gammaproteobacteria bacterium]|nr:phosphate-starvation-inducible PsiE family protein [Gammaproteobacteria bacterium]